MILLFVFDNDEKVSVDMTTQIKFREEDKAAWKHGDITRWRSCMVICKDLKMGDARGSATNLRNWSIRHRKDS